MKKIPHISDAEREVMQAVWNSEQPVTSAQVQQGLGGDRRWKPTTVLTFLSRLCEKGLLRAEKEGKQNRYTALMSENEYRQASARAFLEEFHHGSVRSFMAALADGEGMSPEEIEDLKDWFEKEGDPQ